MPEIASAVSEVLSLRARSLLIKQPYSDLDFRLPFALRYLRERIASVCARSRRYQSIYLMRYAENP
jgi:hypothetical protein